MRQNLKRRAQNYPVRSELKTLVKKALKMIKDGQMEEAVKFMPKVYSIIDTACKKNIIPSNNAARKKSRIARALNDLQSKGGAKAAPAEVSADPAATGKKEETKIKTA